MKNSTSCVAFSWYRQRLLWQYSRLHI